MARPVPPALSALPDRISDLPARLANTHSRHPALIDATGTLTYGELDRAVTAGAQRLRALGVRGGDRVMLINENGIAVVVLLLAIARVDAWALIVNARLSWPEIQAIHAHAQPRLMLFTESSSSDAAAHAIRADATSALWRAADIPIGTVGVSALNTGCEPEPVHAGSERQCAALIYTTGTTGSPKGVMLSHRNLLFVAASSSTLRQVQMQDTVYSVLPIAHVYGLASVCLGTLYGGATLRLEPRFSAKAALRAMALENISIFQGVPAMHARILEYLDTHGETLVAPKLRFVYSGGSPLDEDLKQRAQALYGMALHNGYGLTETSPTVSQTPSDAPREDCSVGYAIPGVEIKTVDGNGAATAAGVVGELLVRGPNVMLGYYHAPDTTRDAVDPEGWLRTGDLARIDADGALHIVGRSKELIIRSGFNVYPAEVEQALNSHPDVVQSAVIGRKVPGNEEVLAFVELKPGASADAEALASWARARLAPYKCPAQIRILAALPAAATGKVLRHKLRDLA